VLGESRDVNAVWSLAIGVEESGGTWFSKSSPPQPHQ